MPANRSGRPRWLRRQPDRPRERSIIALDPFSLIAPTGQRLGDPPPSGWEADLGLSEITTALTLAPRYGSFVRRVLAELNSDLATILWRQAVLRDFLAHPELTTRIRALLPQLADLTQGNSLLGGRKRALLLEVSDRLSQLELYTGIIRDLHAILDSVWLDSEALKRLREMLKALLNDPTFQELVAELPDLRQPLQNLAAIVVGVNLDAQLRPSSAVLLSIADQPIKDQASLLARLIGIPTNDREESGIAPLHHLPDAYEMRILSPLFQDLDRLVTQTAQPVARALERYVRVSYAPLLNLEAELAYFVAAAEMIHACEAKGVRFVAPKLLPLADGRVEIEGLMNIALVLRRPTPPTPSAVRADASGRVAVLTGPNSGGKTTYLQAVGLAQVLAQAGLYLPASQAQLSPVDAILTHFPALETRQQGRLAEEAARLREIFMRTSANSLVLLNESLSSTAFGEALYLAQDILAGFRVIGTRTIFATHLVEIVEHFAEIEAMAEAEGKLISLVAGVTLNADGVGQPTYQIAVGSPLGRSFAREIAARHGISLTQILDARRAIDAATKGTVTGATGATE